MNRDLDFLRTLLKGIPFVLSQYMVVCFLRTICDSSPGLRYWIPGSIGGGPVLAFSPTTQRKYLYIKSEIYWWENVHTRRQRDYYYWIVLPCKGFYTNLNSTLFFPPNWTKYWQTRGLVLNRDTWQDFSVTLFSSHICVSPELGSIHSELLAVALRSRMQKNG